MAEERDEIRKIIEGELTGTKGLVVRRVGRPLTGDELKSAAGGTPKQPAPGDQCCNGAG